MISKLLSRTFIGLALAALCSTVQIYAKTAQPSAKTKVQITKKQQSKATTKKQPAIPAKKTAVKTKVQTPKQQQSKAIAKKQPEVAPALSSTKKKPKSSAVPANKATAQPKPAPTPTAIKSVAKPAQPVSKKQPVAVPAKQQATEAKKPAAQAPATALVQEEQQSPAPAMLSTKSLPRILPANINVGDGKLSLRLNNVELLHLVKYIEDLFNVTFITDDIISPMPSGGKGVLGTKITFQSNNSLTRNELWYVFTAVLDMSGLGVQGPNSAGVYRITKSKNVNKLPLPTYIGTGHMSIPDTYQKIRYIYFAKDSSLSILTSIIDQMKSTTSSPVISYPQMNAIMLSDCATNIRSILEVIEEVDRVNQPDGMSIMRLKYQDATSIEGMYKRIKKAEKPSAGERYSGQRQVKLLTSDAKVIAEPRSNSLIIIGGKDDIRKVEELVKIIDKQDDQHTDRIHLYRCQHVPAATLQNIMRSVTQFQNSSAAAQSGGGIRGGDHILGSMSFEVEPSSNTLIVHSTRVDFLSIEPTLEELDIEQPQVAIQVLIISLDVDNDREISMQVRNKENLLGGNINFQTSNIGSVQTKAGASGSDVLLGNLLGLVSGTSGAQTLITMGASSLGVWGLLRLIETHSRTSVVADPFLVVYNKYKGTTTTSEKRRVLKSTVTNINTNLAYEDLEAGLTIEVTPQISIDNTISLELDVKLDSFTDTADGSNGNRTNKHLNTYAVVGDGEVLAVGGLIKETARTTVSRVPILGSIPVLGHMFSSTSKSNSKESLLILISPKIINPGDHGQIEAFKQQKNDVFYQSVDEIDGANNPYDPICKHFLNIGDKRVNDLLKEFETAQDSYQNTGNEDKKNKKKAKANKKKKRKKKKKSKHKKSKKPNKRSVDTEPVEPKESIQKILQTKDHKNHRKSSRRLTNYINASTESTPKSSRSA